MNIHFVDPPQPFCNLLGSPPRVDDKEFTLASGWRCAATVRFISTHTTTIGELVDINPELGQVGLYFTRSFSSLNQLRASERNTTV